MTKAFDWLIVGAGFTGAVLAERLASSSNSDVLVIDRRSHIAGNAYDYYDTSGVLVHRYGPHIFHTKNRRVWKYLSRFTGWRPYEHRTLVQVEDQLVPVPFNFTSLEALFPSDQAGRLKTLLTDAYAPDTRVPILKLRQAQDSEIRRLAEFVYQHVFEGYTQKQWGLSPTELAPSVTGRVPVVMGYDDRYFIDPYQAMPSRGYTELFKRLLDHRRISVRLNTRFDDVNNEIEYDRVVFTGPIDEFFNRAEGDLPYRSLRFERETHGDGMYQKAGIVNYPNEHAFTRITEFKHLTGQDADVTSIAIEYPQEYQRGLNEPYYPIPRDENRRMFAAYARRASAAAPEVLFAGRLADYRYYNMDQAVARALTLSDRIGA